jgi:hypothetical protein
VVWTLYGSIAKSSQDLHPDMVELISWSRDLGLGSGRGSFGSGSASFR